MAAESSGHTYQQSICICLPLRLGIFVAAFFTLFTSALYLLDTDGVQQSLRHFTGGYCRSSRFFILGIEITGILFGVVGMFGTWYQKRDYVVTFNVWQFARLVGWAYMYYTDIPLVSRCEEWVNNVEAMTKQYGWNHILYDVAMAGDCSGERTRFFVLSFLTLLIFIYIASATLRYQDFMGRTPKHLLRLPKDMTSGAFYAHSTGERSQLNGTWGKQEHNPAPALPPPELLPPQSYGVGGFGSISAA
jgi:hypothetical protein